MSLWTLQERRRHCGQRTKVFEFVQQLVHTEEYLGDEVFCFLPALKHKTEMSNYVLTLVLVYCTFLLTLFLIRSLKAHSHYCIII